MAIDASAFPQLQLSYLCASEEPDMTAAVRLRGRSLLFSSSLRRLLCAAVLTVVMLLAASPSVMAQSKIDPNTEMDGRLFGYEATVGIEKDSTTPLWFVYFILVVIGCSALFKTAKRE
ncbi:hypothetical protein IPV69_02775 [Humisphaera borealis]|uniref:Uncharacterized protein n=2 Tax=Humisphaera borealis TaxID=2807512 RepID=A0A7M2WYL1_9BACT|nr:hypothetical protein IPV69_02775 [Humisphaera borealis]